jgi:NAD(P)-dependent dehydrogenase (short-subunit alcohol dehydrogenase family)
VLFLNAGISTMAPALTEEGYECQFGVNHMGHALLTQLLMPKLLDTLAKKDSDVRIVSVSSLAAYIDVPATGLSLEKMKDPNPLESSYQRYGHSKLANMFFARKLAQAYPSITTTSVNPGQVATELMSKVTGLNKIVLYLLGYTFNWLTAVSALKGAEGQVWASVSKDVKNGGFYDPGFVLNEEAKFFQDQKLTDELWDWTNKELEKHGAPGWPKA